MAKESELREIDRMIEGEFKKIAMDEPVNEARLLSPEVRTILWHNAVASNGEAVEYPSQTGSYSAKFSEAGLKLEDGNIGVITDVPDESEKDILSSITFLVLGLHHSKETSLQFTEKTVFVNPAREHKHIMDFQRAVLTKGTLQK